MEIVFVGLTFLVLFAIINVLIWSRINFGWLQNSVKYLIWSLPFEWFPRLDIGGAGFRLSQGLVLVCFWFLLVLSIKRDTSLLQQKFSKLGWSLPIFVILSSPSWLNILNFNRFFVHFNGTILCFGAAFLIASFESNVYQRLKELSLVIFFTAIFGIYQYIADLVGIPPALTGLREQYTKIVFGVPRVQGTAIEPLYFAGMLMIPILFLGIKSTFEILTQKITLNNNFKLSLDHKDFVPSIVDFVTSEKLFPNLLKLTFILFIFILTLSKGTFGVLFLIVILFGVFAIFYFKNLRLLLKKFGLITFIILFWSIAGLSNSVDPIVLTGEIGKNFVETITGTSSSAKDRSSFLNEALRHIPEQGLVGIGMGQYGTYVGDDLGGLNVENQAIVNNVYIEVLLEEGLFALIWFLMILITPLFSMLSIIRSKNFAQKKELIAAVSIFFILIGYYLQWNLFSPIFIMPIFIILGLSYNLSESKKVVDAK